MSREQQYWLSLGYEDYLEKNITPIVGAYDWEKMDPKAKQKQEQINQFEGFAVLEQLALIQDEIKQLRQIEAVQELLEEEKEYNDKLLNNLYGA